MNKKKPEERKSVMVGTPMTPHLARAITQVARASGITRAEFIRRAVRALAEKFDNKEE